nr:integrase, catalytic region, zinc finger, CCHC-type, peptidase aspartic, catalytic [Tanacetum cinerariifolium]
MVINAKQLQTKVEKSATNICEPVELTREIVRLMDLAPAFNMVVAKPSTSSITSRMICDQFTANLFSSESSDFSPTPPPKVVDKGKGIAFKDDQMKQLMTFMGQGWPALKIPNIHQFSAKMNLKRKRMVGIIQEVFVKENIVVDGMHKNLVSLLGVVASEGLVIREPELEIFFYNGNFDLVYQKKEEFHMATTPQLIRIQNAIRINSLEAKEMYNKMNFVIEAMNDVIEAGKIVLDNLGEVVFGKPFVRETGLVYDKENGTDMFEKDNEKITFKMSHKMERFIHIYFEDVKTDTIPPFVLENDDDHEKTYYSDNLILGPKYKLDESVSKEIRDMLGIEKRLEHIIVAGVENRPPMLEKSMYDSWASRIRLFIKGKKHGRMMLDSIDNGLLVYPTVEENGQTRPKKYSKLTEAQKLQDDCDVQATNIILHSLPPDVQFSNSIQSISVTTTFELFNVSNLPHHHTPVNPQQHPISSSPFIYLSMTPQSQAEFSQLDSGLVVPMFQQGEDPIECINKAMVFLYAVASRFPPSNYQLITSSNPRNQATIQDGRVTVQQVQERQHHSYAAVLMANLSSCDPEVLSEDTDPSAPNDLLVLSLVTQMADHIAHLDKKYQTNKMILDEEQLAFLADPGISEALVSHQTIPHNSAF